MEEDFVLQKKVTTRRQTQQQSVPEPAAAPPAAARGTAMHSIHFDTTEVRETKFSIDSKTEFIKRAKIITEKYFDKELTVPKKIDLFINYAYEYVFYIAANPQRFIDYFKTYEYSRTNVHLLTDIMRERLRTYIIHKEKFVPWVDLLIEQRRKLTADPGTHVPKPQSNPFASDVRECKVLVANPNIKKNIAELNLSIPSFAMDDSIRNINSANKLVVWFHYLSHIGTMYLKKIETLVNPDGTTYDRVVESHALLPGLLIEETVNMKSIKELILRLFGQANMFRKKDDNYVVLRAFYTFHQVDQANTFIVACKRKNECIDPMCEFVHTCPYIDAGLAINMLANKYYNMYVTNMSNIYSGRSLNKIADVSNPLIKFPMIAKSIYTHCIKYSQFMNEHISMTPDERGVFNAIGTAIGMISRDITGTSKDDIKRRRNAITTALEGIKTASPVAYDKAIFKYRNVNKIKTINLIGTLLNLFRCIYKMPMYCAELKYQENRIKTMSKDIARNSALETDLGPQIDNAKRKHATQQEFIEAEKGKFRDVVVLLNRFIETGGLFNSLDMTGDEQNEPDDSDEQTDAEIDAANVTQNAAEQSYLAAGEVTPLAGATGADGGPAGPRRLSEASLTDDAVEAALQEKLTRERDEDAEQYAATRK
jgi:hypothetical protein